ncbi:MAG: HAMP domain-containing histidine kinase [Bacteroidetes bacterium]|nr:HAMP domain-containing histidine kinase [Bacteroidota bacterium]
MTPLLTKITRPFLLFVLLVLLLSIPTYYWIIQKSWVNELDEHNKLLAKRTELEFLRFSKSTDHQQPAEETWNRIHPDAMVQLDQKILSKDSIYTIKEQLVENIDGDDNLRILVTSATIDGKPYRLRISTSFEDSREIVTIITGVTILFFCIVTVGLVWLQRRISKRVWHPFSVLLNQLQHFNIGQQSEIDFQPTDILELEQLQQSLKGLITRSVASYKSQKQFAENASHELQTPLALLKMKLDLMLQSPHLTSSEFSWVEDMQRTVSRSAKINRGLLLLFKIENGQFAEIEPINWQDVFSHRIPILTDLATPKNIQVVTEFSKQNDVYASTVLVEILVDNLLSNAIRYTSPNCKIYVRIFSDYIEVCNPGNLPLDSSILFQRFAKHAGSQSGTGLGLAIAHQICQRYTWDLSYQLNQGLHIFRVHFGAV